MPQCSDNPTKIMPAIFYQRKEKFVKQSKCHWANSYKIELKRNGQRDKSLENEFFKPTHHKNDKTSGGMDKTQMWPNSEN